MPKVIVLLCGSDGSADELGSAAAEGARGVRFTEVDVRTIGSGGMLAQPHKPLGSIDQIREYDGIIVACTAAEMPTELSAIFDALDCAQPPAGFLNKVFAVAGTENKRLFERLRRLGGIIVCTPRDATDSADAGRTIGTRVAKVSEWVRHALSHEQKLHHHHP